MSVIYVIQLYSSYIFSPAETSSKGYLKLNSFRNIIAGLPTIFYIIITKFVKYNILTWSKNVTKHPVVSNY